MMPSAESDAEAIRTYIAQTNKRAAVRWGQTLEHQVFSLRTLPERYEVIPEADEVGLELRHIIFGKYRVIYRVAEDEVIVLRVIHAARMFRRAWLETEPSPEDE
jgi:toxin ParE1/3/4